MANIYIELGFQSPRTFSLISFLSLSFQDTVVALQALTLFQTLTFSKNRHNSVQIFSDRSFNRSFLVNDENRLVPLEILMPEPSGQFTVKVSGNGCVYVQVNWGFFFPLHFKVNQHHHKVVTVHLQNTPSCNYKAFVIANPN